MQKVLVIDDDSTIRLVLKKALQGQGYDVAIAADGREGIAKADELQPNLIICDWMMPYVNGLEVCRWVKTNPKLSTTFFIMLTARGALEDRIKGLDTGADDFLSKPIEIRELQARVRAGLRLHQLSEDLQRQKELLEAELAEAASYVQSLLPAPINEKVFVDSRFIPSRQLGGDCFDYYWLDPDYLMIYLLDVSGHGLGSALPSISVLNLLRSQSLPDVNFYQPQDVLTALNETFQMNNQNDKYFTIWYGVYNRSRRQLTYSSAGHPPAILVTQTADKQFNTKRLRTPGLPVGMLTDAVFSTERLEVPANSKLYVFSDGIYDFNNTDSKQWNLDAFVNLLATANTVNLDDILNFIYQQVGRESLDDDISLLQVQF